MRMSKCQICGNEYPAREWCLVLSANSEVIKVDHSCYDEVQKHPDGWRAPNNEMLYSIK